MNNKKFEIWFSVNTPKQNRHTLASYFGFKIVDSFSKYLGTYIDGYQCKSNKAKEIISKLNKKLQGWKAKLLS